MVYRILSIPVFILALTFAANSVHAFGVYADIPVQYVFSDCTSNCSKSPPGIKAGLIIPGNIGLGAEIYSINIDDVTDISFTFADVSYLLPIPVINLMLGLGMGSVTLDAGTASESGSASQVWASLGWTIAAVVDVHLGYHLVSASVTFPAAVSSTDLSGSMYSLGAMINF